MRQGKGSLPSAEEVLSSILHRSRLLCDKSSLFGEQQRLSIPTSEIDAPNQLTVLGPGVVNVTIGLHKNFTEPRGPDVAWIRINDSRLKNRKELVIAELFPKHCVRFHLVMVNSKSTDAHAHFRWIKQKSTPHPAAINSTVIKRIYSSTIAYKRPEPSSSEVEHVVMCEAREGVPGLYELHYILFSFYDAAHTLDIDCHFAKCGATDLMTIVTTPVPKLEKVTTPVPVFKNETTPVPVFKNEITSVPEMINVTTTVPNLKKAYSVEKIIYNYTYEYYYRNFTILTNGSHKPMPTTKKPNLVTSIKIFNPSTPEPYEFIDIEEDRSPTEETPSIPETARFGFHPLISNMVESNPECENESELYTENPYSPPFSINYIDDVNPEVITTPKAPVKHWVVCRRCRRCWQRIRLPHPCRQEPPSSTAAVQEGAQQCSTGSTPPPCIEPMTTMTPVVVHYQNLNPENERALQDIWEADEGDQRDAASGDSC
ncbi:uncharacterized protein LOC134223516 isoform X2 [Armigeres subalbatus]|uniref:uncharacterized protein LOC134223516 isoform X2 n=1 Tax=Armigeres subalbatus TaxID=124917 RepID=UPI002ED58CF8